MKALFIGWIILLITLLVIAFSGCSFRYENKRDAKGVSHTKIEAEVSQSVLGLAPLLL